MPLKLAGLLVTSGAAPAPLVEDALRRQVLSGCALDTALLDAGLALGEGPLLRLLEKASGLPGVDAAALASTDVGLSSLMPSKLAERHCLMPVRSEGKTLHVAIAYPHRPQVLEEIGFLLGRELKPFIALELRLREAISRLYKIPLPPRFQRLALLLGPVPRPEPSPAPAPERPEPPAAPPAEAPAISPAPATEALPPSASLAAAPSRRSREFALARDRDGLALALEQALEAAEPSPPMLPRAGPPRPRNRVDVAGLARRIVAVSGGTPALDADPPDTWTLLRARAAMDQASDRHQLIRVALRFALKSFDYAAAFAVVGGHAVGWAAQSREGAVDDIERIDVPLDAPSVMRTVLLAKGRYLGPVPTDALSQSLIADLERPQPAAVFLVPVEVRDRPVAILYGDVVGRAIADRSVGEFVAFAQYLGQRIERIIVDQRRRLAAAAAPLKPKAPAADRPGSSPAAEPSNGAAAGPAAPAFALEPPALTGAELFARRTPRERPPAAPGSESAPAAVAPATPPGTSPLPAGASPALPASMDELFAAADQLMAKDLGDRVRALALLARYPEISAAVLVARFPGPVLRARVPLVSLPSPEELGPVPGALARMGLQAARALAPLLEHRDVDTRYFALLTAGNLPAPLLVGPVAQRVFDRHPAVASAARVAIAAMRGVHGFAEALEKVRAGLASRDGEVTAHAARALGLLRDLGSVEKLIGLTGLEPRTVAEAAAEALREISKQSFGLSPARWASWWEQARQRPRTQWLVEALRGRDLELRLSAIDELSRAVGDNFGYYADDPRLQREEAVRRWEAWWEAEGQGRPAL